ncbi:MAG: PD-(D/E)XK nuclease family protein, partial [Patescibacteria group bacterium]|nr:PD-(D/E)XK nuclease family protein [Patescibacteria group bacterium]
MESMLQKYENENGRFYKTPSGKIYPSITTVLAFRKQQKLKKWKEQVGEDKALILSKRANSKGTEIHALLYEYFINKNNILADKYPSLYEVLKPRLEVMKPDFMEISLWSDILKVAGTVDFIGTVDDVPYIVDFKTFSVDGGEYDFDILHDYYLQLTAYSVMVFERMNRKFQNLKIMKISPWKYS